MKERGKLSNGYFYHFYVFLLALNTTSTDDMAIKEREYKAKRKRASEEVLLELVALVEKLKLRLRTIELYTIIRCCVQLRTASETSLQAKNLEK